jgi:hypothetical protein
MQDVMEVTEQDKEQTMRDHAEAIERFDAAIKRLSKCIGGTYTPDIIKYAKVIENMADAAESV